MSPLYLSLFSYEHQHTLDQYRSLQVNRYMIYIYDHFHTVANGKHIFESGFFDYRRVDRIRNTNNS